MEKFIIKKMNEAYYYEQLVNGLRVYLMPRPNFQTTHAYLATNYGSCDNEFIPIGQTTFSKVPDGIAHFLEHKLFEAPTGDAPEDLFSKYGAEYNAYTTNETTAYTFATTNHVAECLTILLNFVLKKQYSANGIEREKDIIEQELLMYLDRHQSAFHLATLQAIYLSHPVRIDIGGTVDSIKDINKDLLDLCHRTFYHPSNLVLVMVGPFDQNEILQIVKGNSIVQQWKTPLEKPIERYILDEGIKVNNKDLTLTRDVFVPSSKISLKLPYYNLGHQEMVKLSFVMRFWLHYAFSKIYPFYNKLHVQKIIDKGINRTVEIARTFAYISVSATTSRYAEFEKAVKRKILGLAKATPSQKALDLYKKMVTASIISQFDFNDSICSMILTDALNGGTSDEVLTSIEEITLEEVLAYRHHFSKEAIVITRMLPKT